jgi:hypothetical protein
MDVAPEIHALRGEIRVVDQRIPRLDLKINGVDARLTDKIQTLDDRLTTKIDSLRTETAGPGLGLHPRELGGHERHTSWHVDERDDDRALRRGATVRARAVRRDVMRPFGRERMGAVERVARSRRLRSPPSICRTWGM